MNNVRLGIIGAGGGMAGGHLHYLPEMEGVEVAALCEIDEQKLRAKAEDFPQAKTFTDGDALIDSGEVDAVLIATPHYAHPTYAQHAFATGIHVLCEKPVAVTAKAAQETNDAYAAAKKKHPNLVYEGMFQSRTDPLWQYVHRLCHDGTLGELMRVNWTITTWFRTQAYYDSGGWRATWEGEGGGVLLNQCPHNLDLFQWFVGLPAQVSAQVGIGKHHHIEVEDEVTALFQFPNGAVGTFITSTGETPGVNRLEIVGDHGTLIVENKTIRLREAQTPVREFTQTCQARFANVTVTEHEIKPGGKAQGHRGITENFINAIRHGEELIAPGIEGIRGLELGNAMLGSGLNQGQLTPIPTDRDGFENQLQGLIDNSSFEKPEVRGDTADIAASF